MVFVVWFVILVDVMWICVVSGCFELRVAYVAWV